MAKYERRITGDFRTILARLHHGILDASISATYEDGSEWSSDGVRCAVRVYERYSALGGNRVSMTVMLAGKGTDLSLTAITAGGSRALFFKIDTWGEEAFLDTLRSVAKAL